MYHQHLCWISENSPTLTVVPTTETIESGTDVALTCVTTNSGENAEYSFFRNENLIATKSCGTHILENIGTSDSGIYTCKATISTTTSEPSSGHKIRVVSKCLKYHIFQDILYVTSSSKSNEMGWRNF